jgi:hypothetical protein
MRRVFLETLSIVASRYKRLKGLSHQACSNLFFQRLIFKNNKAALGQKLKMVPPTNKLGEDCRQTNAALIPATGDS